MPRQTEVNGEDVEALAAAVSEYTEADHELKAFCTEATLKVGLGRHIAVSGELALASCLHSPEGFTPVCCEEFVEDILGHLQVLTSVC